MIDRKAIEEFISRRAVGIDEAILETELYNKLASERESILYSNSIYWNEIDQRVFHYRSDTYNLLAKRIRAFVNSLLDPITLACIARQIMEIALSATANQWVIHYCWDALGSKLGGRNKVDAAFLTWDGLERFCIGLCSWSEKHMKMMADILSVDTVRPKSAEHFVNVNYEPTLSRQIAVARWYSKSELLSNRGIDLDLSATIDVAERNYKFLCKFVHPSPQMLELHHGPITKAQIHVAVVISSLEAIVAGLNIANSLVFDDRFVGIRFQDLVEENLYKFPGSRVISMYDEILPQVLNKYKDIVIPGNEGNDIEIHKFSTLSEKSKTVARDFYNLTAEGKSRLLQVLQDLKQVPNSEMNK